MAEGECGLGLPLDIHLLWLSTHYRRIGFYPDRKAVVGLAPRRPQEAIAMPFADIEAKREYQRRWREQRRNDFFKHRTCQDCGSYANLCLFYRDHSQKVYQSPWGLSAHRLQAELEKCDVVCADCSHKRALARIKPTDHGKLWMYQRYGCRCDECRVAKAEETKRNRTVSA